MRVRTRAVLLVVCIIASFGARPDNMDDAFNQGAAAAKQSSGLGTDALKDSGVVSGTIPGYTANPPQSSYYGGVTGGDGGLSDAGQAALSGNDAAQTVIKSGQTNPQVSIDPNATYITNGKNAEANAASIADGTNSQCTESVVSKSTFENYSCDKDVATVETCARNGVASGHWEMAETVQTITIQNEQFVYTHDGDMGVNFYFNSPISGQILSGEFDITVANRDAVWMDSSIQILNTYISRYTKGGVGSVTGFGLDSSIGYNINAGPSATFKISSLGGYPSFFANTVRSNYSKTAQWLSSGGIRFTLILTVRTVAQKWVPRVDFQESCNFDKSQGHFLNTVCSVEGGDRVIDGQAVHSDCWQYTDSYLVPINSPGTCSTYTTNPNCTVIASSCSESTDGNCTHQALTYQCQKTFTSKGLLCGGTYYCKSGDCSDTAGAGDSGFDTAVAKLAGLASAGDDVKNDQINIKAFSGQAMSCRKAAAGFSNCCKDSGWGQDVGLQQCNSEELAIGKAKAKRIVVSVGEKCDHQVLGICIQKSQVYCVFGGKLARIIQEQGRRDQLGVGFGSGDSPNCRGITVPELQSINFDLINFSDFYQDLMDNQKIPDTDTMVKQAKDRIAAQVNQSGKTK